MLRARCLPALALALLLWSGAAPAGASHRHASVALEQCATGASAAERFAVWVGRMRALPGATGQQLRFSLQARAGGRWTTVPGERLGEWRTAEPGVRAYVFSKRVEGLAAPGAYRTVVQFRWLDEHGSVVHGARRVSAVCRQPDLRPDLAPAAVAVERDPAGGARYRVAVRNLGPVAAGSFEVAVEVVGAGRLVATAPQLGPGAVAAVELTGPACEPGATLRVIVDPAAAVPERDETRNALAARCPAG